jgi:adenine-specific DNA-methyltransferase
MQFSNRKLLKKDELYITQDLYLRRIVNEPREKALKDIFPRLGENTKGSYNDINLLNLFKDGWGSNEDGIDEIRSLFANKPIMDYPKPRKLILKLIVSLRDNNAVVLDFFSGSCTTAHAVLDLNKQDNGTRKFICVQLPEKCDEKSEAFKAGYKTIADIGKERIRRVIKKIKDSENGKLPFAKTNQDLGFKVFKLQTSNFKIWRGDNIKNGRQLEKQKMLLKKTCCSNCFSSQAATSIQQLKTPMIITE